MIDPILIDECLSPRLVGVAKRRGHQSFHVVWINREGYGASVVRSSVHDCPLVGGDGLEPPTLSV